MEAGAANEQTVSQVISAARAKKPHYPANYCSIFSQTSGAVLTQSEGPPYLSGAEGAITGLKHKLLFRNLILVSTQRQQ